MNIFLVLKISFILFFILIIVYFYTSKLNIDSIPNVIFDLISINFTFIYCFIILVTLLFVFPSFLLNVI